MWIHPQPKNSPYAISAVCAARLCSGSVCFKISPAAVQSHMTSTLILHLVSLHGDIPTADDLMWQGVQNKLRLTNVYMLTPSMILRLFHVEMGASRQAHRASQYYATLVSTSRHDDHPLPNNGVDCNLWGGHALLLSPSGFLGLARKLTSAQVCHTTGRVFLLRVHFIADSRAIDRVRHLLAV